MRDVFVHDLGCNVLVLRGEGGLLMVDSGSLLHRARFERLLRRVRPDALLLTHHHIDHRANVDLAARAGVQVLVHHLDLPFVTGLLFHMPVSPHLPTLGSALARLHPRLRQDHVRGVDEGEVIFGWTVLHLPGHTPGQVGLLSPDGRDAVVADAVISRAGRAYLPRRNFNADHDQARATLRRVAALPAERVWCGHGPVLPIAAVRERAQRGSAAARESEAEGT